MIHELPQLTSTRSNHSGMNNHGWGEKDSSINISNLGLDGARYVSVCARGNYLSKSYANAS
jgi:hypothetical protein